MSNTVIRVEDISKLYRLGDVGTGTISHDLKRWWYRARGKEDPYAVLGEANNRAAKGSSEYVWALQHINFSVQQGEVLGVVGRNGAGKSTLLKILSRTTGPTTGNIKIKGRVASLLEVGTGFHPELTGKENIYLNGAILGMRKKEITRKLDEIIEFAGVERYINTPVKRYSSGMYVRLAFAVAAHLESEILIIDEVLAVGDAEFQKKCLGKMGDVSRGEGRTVLFVSHNMAAVKQLCTCGIMLNNGGLEFTGTQLETVRYYQSSDKTSSFFDHKGDVKNAPGNDLIRILKFFVRPATGDYISISSGVEFEIEFFNAKADTTIGVTFEVKNSEEVTVFHHGVALSEENQSQKGVYSVKGIIPPNLLNAGVYLFNLIFGENQRYLLFHVTDFIKFEVMNESFGSNSNLLPGVIRPDIRYTVNQISSY